MNKHVNYNTIGIFGNGPDYDDDTRAEEAWELWSEKSDEERLAALEGFMEQARNNKAQSDFYEQYIEPWFDEHCRNSFPDEDEDDT